MNQKISPGRAAPRAARRPFTDTHHGIVREDDYAWLRASNWQEVMRDPAVLDPAIRAHLEAENAYSKNEMADIEKLQAALFAEMKARIKEDDESVPSPDGPFEYYTRFVTGGQHPLFCRKPRKGSEERVLIDGNALAAGHAYFRIGGVSHSPDHKLIAYAVDTKGSEFFTIRIVDAETGALVDTNITDTNGDMQWDNDSSGLFYIWVDDEHRPRRVLRHVVGADATDAVIRDQKDPGFFLGIDSTQSRRFLLLSVHDHETSEVSIIDTESRETKPVLVAKREMYGDEVIALLDEAELRKPEIDVLDEATWPAI